MRELQRNTLDDASSFALRVSVDAQRAERLLTLVLADIRENDTDDDHIVRTAQLANDMAEVWRGAMSVYERIKALREDCEKRHWRQAPAAGLPPPAAIRQSQG